MDEASFNRIKKVWIAREYKIIDNIEEMADDLYYDIVKYGKVIPKRIDIIKSMKFKVLKDLVKKIDFTNYSVVKMKNK